MLQFLLNTIFKGSGLKSHRIRMLCLHPIYSIHMEMAYHQVALYMITDFRFVIADQYTKF